jgi:energy-coupling factor transporter transmembrane protein EcfT
MFCLFIPFVVTHFVVIGFVFLYVFFTFCLFIRFLFIRFAFIYLVVILFVVIRFVTESLRQLNINCERNHLSHVRSSIFPGTGRNLKDSMYLLLVYEVVNSERYCWFKHITCLSNTGNNYVPYLSGNPGCSEISQKIIFVLNPKVRYRY